MTEKKTEGPPASGGGFKSIFDQMADHLKMDPKEFRDHLSTRVMRNTKEGQKPTVSQVGACLVVAREYDLNPLTDEISFFMDKWGNLRAVVPIDGWLTIINRHPAMNGLKSTPMFDGVPTGDHPAKLLAYSTVIHRKDRDEPIEITEFLDECQRNTDPWQQWPHRMLRHKSIIQCARVAFGLVGIQDEDEFERTIESQTRTMNATAGSDEFPTSGRPALEEHKPDTTLEDVMRHGTGPEEPVAVGVERAPTQAEMDAADAKHGAAR